MRQEINFHVFKKLKKAPKISRHPLLTESAPAVQSDDCQPAERRLPGPFGRRRGRGAGGGLLLLLVLELLHPEVEPVDGRLHVLAHVPDWTERDGPQWSVGRLLR